MRTTFHSGRSLASVGSVRAKGAVALALIIVLTGAVPAGAASFEWTKVGKSAANFAQARLARTGDGVLHLAWVADNVADPLTRDILAAVISPAGALGSKTAIQSGWSHIDPVPDLLVAPDGSLRAFWGGTRSIAQGDPNQFGVSTATAPASGTPWTFQVGNVTQGSEFGGGVAATYSTDGTSLQVSGNAFVHRGLSPATPNYDYHAALGGCCAYGGNIATDKVSGEIFIVWYADTRPNTDPVGVYARQVDPASGAPAAAPIRMPGSVTMYNGREESSNPIARIPLEARAGGGLYTIFAGGYPSLNKVLLWRLGDPTSTTVATSSDLNHAVDVE